MLRFFTLLLATAVVVRGDRMCRKFLPQSDRCEEGWALFNDHCYWVSHERATHSEAVEICSSNSSHLASIHSDEENVFVKELLESRSPDTCEGWIGLQHQRRSIYAWDDGTAWDYENWISDCPNLNGTAIYSKMRFYNGKRSRCDTSAHYNGNWTNSEEDRNAIGSAVCKKAANDLPPQAPSLSGTCEEGWSFFNGSCFTVTHDTITFSEADSFCTSHSAHMTSIHSLKENEFVIALFGATKDPAGWIGFESINGTTPAWIDGTAWDFDNIVSKSHPNGGGRMLFECFPFGDKFIGKWLLDTDKSDKQYGTVCRKPALEIVSTEN